MTEMMIFMVWIVEPIIILAVVFAVTFGIVELVWRTVHKESFLLGLKECIFGKE